MPRIPLITWQREEVIVYRSSNTNLPEDYRSAYQKKSIPVVYAVQIRHNSAVVSRWLPTNRIDPRGHRNLVRQNEDGRPNVVRRAVEQPRLPDLAGDIRRPDNRPVMSVSASVLHSSIR